MFGRKKAKRKKPELPAQTPEAITTDANVAVADGSEKSALETPDEIGLAPTAQSDPGATATGPPLYGQPGPLSSEKHGAWRLAKDRDYSFAREAALVPLNAAEFPLASRHYPIVFAAQGNISMAVLGAAGINGFVGPDGQWRAMSYVPAYVRRYPFLFMAAPEDQYVLSIDEAYDGFGDVGDPLFTGGEGSEITKNALAFCQVFEREFEATSRFISALDEASVLSAELPVFNRAGGRKLTVKGVRAIDRSAYDSLPGDVVLNWRQEGWLPAVYAHLNSMSNWDQIGS